MADWSQIDCGIVLPFLQYVLWETHGSWLLSECAHYFVFGSASPGRKQAVDFEISETPGLAIGIHRQNKLHTLLLKTLSTTANCEPIQ